MKFCFTGDLFLGGDLTSQYSELNISSYIFNSADYRVVNLEQPICDSSYVEKKCTLYTGSSSLNYLLDNKIDAVNLAHNHIQDKGLDGIANTCSHLDSVGIGHFGAGDCLSAATKPHDVSGKIAIFGYCDFKKPYLKEVVVADENTPGINPLRLEKILADLETLNIGQRAIIYLHWGMEHISLPPLHDIKIMKKLLEDNRVITVIGMHAHRSQGIIEHAGKVGFMCLGNFMFPNFYIAPPTQLSYPEVKEQDNVKHHTYLYHHVYKLTYKKWLWINRVSMMVSYDDVSEEITFSFVKQKKEKPEIIELNFIEHTYIRFRHSILSIIYKFPEPVYKLLYLLQVRKMKVVWRLKIGFFHLQQLSLKSFIKKFKDYVYKKAK